MQLAAVEMGFSPERLLVLRTVVPFRGLDDAPRATAFYRDVLADLRALPGVTAIGAGTSFVGAYISYFLDGATGGVIVTLQTLLFLAAFYLAPKHGVIAARRRPAALPGVIP